MRAIKIEREGDMKHVAIGLLMMSISAQVYATCTDQVRIKELWPREAGWVHIVGEGVANMDLRGCGNNSSQGMLFNFNNTSGTPEGKMMLYSLLVAAYTSGQTMKLCSASCDPQHPEYSRLTHINSLQKN